MLVRLLPGASLENLRRTLRELGSAVSNLRGPQPTSRTRDLLTSYMRWASTAASQLRGQIIADDIDRLVFTSRYQLLASKVGMLYPDLDNSGLEYVLTAELDERVVAFESAQQTLVDRAALWSQSSAFVAFDTSFYIQHGEKLEDVDIPELISADSAALVHLIVPMIVVDELDRLKQGAGNKRWRAGYTTALLYRVLGNNPTAPVRLRDDDPRCVVELWPDPPGHIRLPIADDEIIDRVVAVQTLSEHPVNLVTYDTGQALRAKLAGLTPLHLTSADSGRPSS